MRIPGVLRQVELILKELDTASAHLLTKHLKVRFDIEITPKELASVLRGTNDIVKIRSDYPKTHIVYARKGYERR